VNGHSAHRNYFQFILCQIILSEIVDLAQFPAIPVGVHPEGPPVRLWIRPTCRGANNRFPSHTGGGRKRVVCLPVKINFAVWSH
jgi:hypothetical protein